MSQYKVWAIHLCHNDPDIIEESIEQYLKTKSQNMVETVHVFLNQHWPINYQDFEDRIKSLSQRVNGIYLDAGKNLGLHDGFNWAVNQLQIPDNAGVIGYDPDSYPVTQGWDLAMCKVVTDNPRIVWVSLWTPHTKREIEERNSIKWSKKINGVLAVSIKGPLLNSVCMINRGWLRSVGGLTEPSKFYGGLECAMFPKIKDMEWVYLPEYEEKTWFQDRVNPLYRQWKWEHAIKGTAPMSFEDWVKAR